MVRPVTRLGVMKIIAASVVLLGSWLSACAGWTNEPLVIPLYEPWPPAGDFQFVASLSGQVAFPPNDSTEQGSLTLSLTGNSLTFWSSGLPFTPSTAYILTAEGTPVSDLGMPFYLPGGGPLEGTNYSPGTPGTWSFLGVRGISDDVRADLFAGGYFVNIGNNDSGGFIGGQINPTPEPSVLAMLILGTGVVLLSTSKKSWPHPQGRANGRDSLCSQASRPSAAGVPCRST
jgi:hypothetical protein